MCHSTSFKFLWWLVLLGIFLYVDRSLIHHFNRNVYLTPLHTFQSSIPVFAVQFASAFLVLRSCAATAGSEFGNIGAHSPRYLLYLLAVDFVLWQTNRLNFMYPHLCNLALVPVFFCHIQKVITKSSGITFSLCVSCKGFYSLRL
jgi:hypothetical protein